MAIVKISDLPLVDQPVEGTDLFVVVQDNVTKKAYASDIQTYVGFEEVQYATAGQTVFNLTTMSYAPGGNNLMVFVDGVNQYEGLSYTETNSTRVTFTQGLHVGAVVKFSTVQTQTSSVASSAAVTFLQAGTGAVQTNVQTRLRETVSVKDFGAIGNGIADDSAAIQAAIDYCAIANPVGANPNQGYAKAILYFPPGVYLCKSTLTFRPFINYVGVRATTASTSSNTSNQEDSRGSIIRADVAIYNNNNATQGTLVYVPAGDMYISNITFVGTAGITGNPSVGIQWGSSGGVANTGKPFETDGTGQNVAGIKIDGCTFYTFTKAWVGNTLNECYSFFARWEANTVDISFETNTYLPGVGQSAQFYGCLFYGHYIGMSFSGGPSYDISMTGGYFQGKQSDSRNIQFNNASTASSFYMGFSNVTFGQDYATAYSINFNGKYDAVNLNMSWADCSFTRGAINLARGGGTAKISNWAFNNCNFKDLSFTTNIAQDGLIQGGRFDNSSLTMDATTYTKITNVLFKNLSGTAVSFATANCNNNQVVNNSFVNVTTPISVVDNATNASILFSNNIGVTACPPKGVILDNINGITFANLGTPSDGSVVYCPNGTIANPVASGGTGCIAKRLNGVWVGN